METNIDDCSGEMLGFVMEQLLDQGALDVFFTSIFMKKNRPAYRLTVVCNEDGFFTKSHFYTNNNYWYSLS